MIEVSETGIVRPHVFVGSSTEGLSVANTLQVLLDYDAEVEIWNQGTFEPGGTTLESLMRSARTFDFAVLIVTPDDAVESRGTTRNVTRDNVLFELGLFIGALGKERVYMLYDRDNRPDLPSDLAGVTPVTYAPHKTGNLRASLGAASTQLRDVFRRLGKREAQQTEDELSHPSPTSADLDIMEADLDEQPLDLDVEPVPAVDDAEPTPQPWSASAEAGASFQTSAAQTVTSPAVSDAEIEQVGELVRDKRMSYPSASSFYRDFEDGKWLDRFAIPPALKSEAARELTKQKWLREADLTRSWDHSNVVFMRLELIADRLTEDDIDKVLDLPTQDAQGHDQEAGLWSFLEFLEGRYPGILTEKARQRLAEFRSR